VFLRVWKAFNAVRIIQSENRRARKKLIGWEKKLSCFICVADVVFVILLYLSVPKLLIFLRVIFTCLANVIL